MVREKYKWSRKVYRFILESFVFAVVSVIDCSMVHNKTEERGDETLRKGMKLAVLSVISSQKCSACYSEQSLSFVFFLSFVPAFLSKNSEPQNGQLLAHVSPLGQTRSLSIV